MERTVGGKWKMSFSAETAGRVADLQFGRPTLAEESDPRVTEDAQLDLPAAEP